ncbi:hypothetical protein QNO00_16910 [Arthrobacter sp. zg-Y1219]|nr:hypothetical protein [Arthrobacter sp. zg-Y1219]
MTEERAAEIADKRARLVLEEYSREAAPKAFARIQELDQRVVSILANEGKLDALREPSYQIALQKAQISAASTEREGDYDLLARLLGQRANQDSRFVRASVDRAVQVVDMIDDAALRGLNMMWVISAFTPGGNSLGQGVKLLEGLLGKFPSHELPRGQRWLDHLDIIDLVRIIPGSLTTLKKFVPLYADKWPGFLSMGVEEDVAKKVHGQSTELGVAALQMVAHDLKPGYYRLRFHSTNQMRNVMREQKLPEDKIESAVEIALSVCNLETKDDALVPKLEELVAASDALKEIADWWDQIPDFPQPTTAGITVAYANSRRYHQFENTTGLAEYLEQST